MTLLINLFGAPGAGKSTTATGAFSLLKMADVNCEYVSEYAKDATWEDRHTTLKSQPYIHGKQLRNVERLIGKVDAIITDSPTLLSAFYGRKYANYPESFYTFVLDQFNSMNNLNILLKRVKPYNPSGRNQNEAESDAIGGEMQAMLDDLKVPYIVLNGDREAPAKVRDIVLAALKT